VLRGAVDADLVLLDVLADDVRSQLAAPPTDATMMT
jgi:hypothetical protein